MAAQIVPGTPTNLGFDVDYRCDVCFRNIFEAWQWFCHATYIKDVDFGVSKCPYCNAPIEFDLNNVTIPFHNCVHILKLETGTWQWLFKTDQDPTVSLDLEVRGTVGKEINVDWGDKLKNTYILTPGINHLTHTYQVIGTYIIKLFDPDLAISTINFFNQSLSGTIDNLTNPFSFNSVNLRQNSFSGTIPDFTDNSNITSLTISQNNLTGTIPDLSNLTLLKLFIFNNNSLSGTLPSLSANTLLEWILGYNNNLSGTFPGISLLPNLKYVYFSGNSFTGSVPDHSSNTNIIQIDFNGSSMTGTLASFTTLTMITSFSINDNSISNYTASTLSLTLITFRLRANSLPQSAVDQVLSDFNTNLASRPAAGTIWLDGTGMAAPSAAGIIWKNNIITHGWTVLTN